eukprot:5211192-Amphidinium_carterae.1
MEHKLMSKFRNKLPSCAKVETLRSTLEPRLIPWGNFTESQSMGYDDTSMRERAKTPHTS